MFQNPQLPDTDRNFFNSVKLITASRRGSKLNSALETTHMSTSDVSAPKPVIVEPTK